MADAPRPVMEASGLTATSTASGRTSPEGGAASRVLYENNFSTDTGFITTETSDREEMMFSHSFVNFGDEITLFSMDRSGFLSSHVSGSPYAGLHIKPVKKGSDARAADSSFDIRTATFVIRPPELVVERNKLRKLVRSTRINDRKAQITRKSQFLEEQQQSFQAEGHPVHHMSSTASAAPTRAPTITGEDDEGLESTDKRGTTVHLRPVHMCIKFHRTWRTNQDMHRSAVVAESLDNNLQQERAHGKPVEYGQVIQLYNPLRRKFVRVSPTRSAEVEPSNMRIELHSEVSDFCSFRIMPRYKIRSIGDFICQGDDIMLEELDLDQRGRNQYVHGCKDQLGTNVHLSSIYSAVGKGRHEAVLSATLEGSSFDIRCTASGGTYTQRSVPSESVEAFMRKQVQSVLKQKGVEAKAAIPEKQYMPINTNSIIQIEHKDSASFLQAEGQYNWNEGEAFKDCYGIKHDVYLHCGSKKREANNPKTSALTYFKIEKNRATEGGTVAWDEPIRLKHLPTGLYLAVNSESKTHLIPLQSDSVDAGKTLFKMVPFLRANETERAAHSNTLFRLQNCESRMWICGNDGYHATRIGNVAEVLLTDERESTKAGGGGGSGNVRKGTALLQASVSKLCETRGRKMELGTSPTAPFKDTFQVRLVKDTDIHEMGFVSGCLQVLHEYVARKKKTGKLNRPADNLLVLLKEMDAFIYMSGIPQRSRQKMYRDFKVIDLLIEMLKAPYSTPCNRPEAKHLLTSFSNTSVSADGTATNASNGDVAKVNNAIFLVLESYLKGNSRKNELYVAKHIPLFWNMFGTDMDVEHMFTEMVRDNSILVSFFKKEHIQVIVELLKEEQNPDYLTFLSVLCVCQEKPRRVLQDIIGRLLFEGFDPRKHPFFYTTMVDVIDEVAGTAVVRVSSTDLNTNQGVTLASFFASGMDGDEITTTDRAKFLNRQLLLFGRLCRGRHTANIEVISRDYVPWDECFLCAQKTDLPLVLRTYYTRVLMNIYVDVNPNRDVLSEVQLNYEWEKIGATDAANHSVANDRTKSISGATFLQFVDVHKWITGILHNNKTLFYDAGSECENGTAQQKNEYLAGVLRLLHKLVIFGYYTNVDDIDPVLELLIALLDGKTDKEKSGRRRQSMSTSDWAHTRRGLPAKAVHECKHQALLCVDGLLNFAMHSRIRLVLADFKQVFLALPEEEGSTFWGSIAHESKLALIAREMVGTQQHYSPQVTPIRTKGKKKHHRWGRGRNKVAAADALAAGANKQRVNKMAGIAGDDGIAADGDDDDNDGDDDDDHHNPAKLMLRLAMEVVQGMQRGTTDIIIPKSVKAKAYKVTNIIRKYIAGHNQVQKWNTSRLARVLLDLAQYPSHRLRESSLNLLHRISTQQKTEFSLSMKGRVLLSQQTIALARKAYSDTSIDPRSGEAAVGQAGVPNLKLWCQGGFFLDSDAEHFIEALNSLSMDCFHRDRIQGADHLKQKVLFNAGVHTVVLNIIRNTEPTKPRVLRACFNFLASLIDGLPLAQAKIHNELDMILNIHKRKQYAVASPTSDELAEDRPQGYEPWQNALGRMLSNLFAHNIEASLGIRSAQIELILELIALWTWRAPQLLSALTMVATSQEWNIPLRRNQEVIVLNLWKNRVKVLHTTNVGVVMDRNAREVKRMTMLGTSRCEERADRDTTQWELEYHINLIDLLSSACAGKSTQIEAKCRRLLTLDEVVATLKSVDVPPINKGPYMTFLMWVHLNTELNVPDSNNDGGGGDDGDHALDDDGDAYEEAATVSSIDVLEMLAAARETSLAMLSPYARALSGEKKDHDDISMSGRRERYFIFDQFIPFITCLLSMEIDWFLDGHNVAFYIETIVQEVANLVTCTRAQSSRTGAKLGKFRSYRIKELVSAVYKVIHPDVPITTFTSKGKVATTPKQREFETFNPDAIRRIEKIITVLQDGYEKPVQHRRPSAIQVQRDVKTGTDIVTEDDEGMEEVELDVNILFNAFIKVLETSFESENTIERQLRLPPSVAIGDDIVDDGDYATATAAAAAVDDDDDDDANDGGGLLRNIEDQGKKPYADDEFGDLPLGPAFQDLTHCFVKASRFRKFLVGASEDGAGDVGIATGGLFDRKLLYVLRKLFEGYHPGTDTNIQVALLQAVRGVIRAAHIIGTQCLIATQDQVATELAVPLARFPLRSNVVAVRSETLEVLRSVVHGGNATAQRVMTAYFLSSRDEKFFIIVDGVLAKAKQSILERESLLTQKAEADAFQAQMRQELGPFHKFVSIDLTVLDKQPVSKQAEQLYKMWNFDEAELTLEILQLFCEGHNTFLQNYIRNQEDNYGSGKNLVLATTQLLSTATSAVVNNSSAFSTPEEHDFDGGSGGDDAAVGSNSSLTLVTEILEFLNESAGGNLQNIEVIANSKALDNVVVLLHHTRALKDAAQDKSQKTPIERDWHNPEDNSIFDEDVIALDIACANLLRTFLESNSAFTRAIMWKVDKSVNMSDIFYQMSAYHIAGEQESLQYLASPNVNKHSLKEQERSKEVGNRYFLPAFSFYTIVARLQDLTGINHSSVLNETQRQSIYYAKIEKEAVSVEIWVDDTLQKVYFNQNPELLNLFIGPKDGVMRTRNTRELEWTNNQGKDRAENFVLTCRAIIADHRRINAFLIRTRLSKYLIDFSPFFRDFMYVLSWLINCLMVCFWAAKDGDYPHENWHYAIRPLVPVFTTGSSSGNSWLHSALLVLAILHMLASLLFCVSYFLRKPPTAFIWKEDAWFPSFTFASDVGKRRREKQFSDAQLRLLKKVGVDVETGLHSLTTVKLDEVMLQQGDVGKSAKEIELLESIMDVLVETDKATKLESQMNSASLGAINVLRELTVSQLIPDSDASQRNILNSAFVYILVFFAMSVYGLIGLCESDKSLAVSYGYIYSFHLLQPINDNDILRRVLQAVTRNGWSLLAVFGLMLKVIYIYALMAFAYMRETFDPEEGMQCEYVWQCLVTGVRAGLMSGGGLGEALAYAGVRSVPLFGEHSNMVVADMLRVFFDLSFFILVTTIGLNVVFGIIIDTFSELREEKSEVDEAIKTKCFICGFQADEFERNDSENGGWSNHRDKDHNIWNYLMFINHVAVQNPTDYTYMESKVAEQLMNNEVDWMPIGRALGLQGKVSTVVGESGGAAGENSAGGGAGDGAGTNDGDGASGGGGGGGGGAAWDGNAATHRQGKELHSKLDALSKTMGNQHASLQAVHTHVSTLLDNVAQPTSDVVCAEPVPIGIGSSSISSSNWLGDDGHDDGGRLRALETAVSSQQAATAAMDAKIDSVDAKLDILTALLLANNSNSNITSNSNTRSTTTLLAAPLEVTPVTPTPTFQVRHVETAWEDSANEREGRKSTTEVPMALPEAAVREAAVETSPGKVIKGACTKCGKSVIASQERDIDESGAYFHMNAKDCSVDV